MKYNVSVTVEDETKLAEVIGLSSSVSRISVISRDLERKAALVLSDQGWKQQEIANLFGMQQGTVSRWIKDDLE